MKHCLKIKNVSTIQKFHFGRYFINDLKNLMNVFLAVFNNIKNLILLYIHSPKNNLVKNNNLYI